MIIFVIVYERRILGFLSSVYGTLNRENGICR